LAEQNLRSGAVECGELGPFSSWHIVCEGRGLAARGGARGAPVRLHTIETTAKANMKINQWIVMAGMAAMMSLGTSQVLAQPNSGGQRGPGAPGSGGRSGRGFDPAQMQQRIMERYKEMLEVTNDDEWKAIEPRVQKVMDLRRDSFSGMARGFFGRGPRGGDRSASGDQGQQRRGMFGAPNPEADALQKAIDSKASKAEMKAALEKYVASRKAKQAEMEKAQVALRELLTPRQEAIATLNGLL
jgi:hypothetical protein